MRVTRAKSKKGQDASHDSKVEPEAASSCVKKDLNCPIISSAPSEQLEKSIHSDESVSASPAPQPGSRSSSDQVTNATSISPAGDPAIETDAISLSSSSSTTSSSACESTQPLSQNLVLALSEQQQCWIAPLPCESTEWEERWREEREIMDAAAILCSLRYAIVLDEKSKDNDMTDSDETLSASSSGISYKKRKHLPDDAGEVMRTERERRPVVLEMDKELMQKFANKDAKVGGLTQKWSDRRQAKHSLGVMTATKKTRRDAKMKNIHWVEPMLKTKVQDPRIEKQMADMMPEKTVEEQMARTAAQASAGLYAARRARSKTFNRL